MGCQFMCCVYTEPFLLVYCVCDVFQLTIYFTKSRSVGPVPFYPFDFSWGFADCWFNVDTFLDGSDGPSLFSDRRSCGNSVLFTSPLTRERETDFLNMALRKVKGNLERIFDKNLTDLVRGIRNNKDNEVCHVSLFKFYFILMQLYGLSMWFVLWL